MDVSISPLDPRRSSHVQLYRSIRLRALAADPDAFGSTHEREAAFDDGQWQQRVAGFRERPGAVFIARLSAALQLPSTASTALGVVGVGESVDAGDATLWGMWVAPTGRGGGIATRLIRAAEQWTIEQGHSSITLWVRRTNGAAVHRYERSGFTVIDAAEHGVAEPDGCHDEICMRLAVAVAHS